MEGTSSPEEIVSTKLQRVAELAREAPQRVLTTLARHIDLWWLYVAYQRTRKDGATGVDGVTGVRAGTGQATARSAQRPEVRHVPRARGAAGAHPEGGR